MPNLLSLPDEILTRVYQNLSHDELFICLTLCKRLYPSMHAAWMSNIPLYIQSPLEVISVVHDLQRRSDAYCAILARIDTVTIELDSHRQGQEQHPIDLRRQLDWLITHLNPRVLSLCTDDYPHICETIAVGLEPTRLTKLALRGQNIDRIYALLQKASETLVTLSLGEVRDLPLQGSGLEHSPLNFPRLETLEIGFSDWMALPEGYRSDGVVAQIFPGMTNLRKLTLHGRSDYTGQLLQLRSWPIAHLMIATMDATLIESVRSGHRASTLAEYLPVLEVLETYRLAPEAIALLPPSLRRLECLKLPTSALLLIEENLANGRLASLKELELSRLWSSTEESAAEWEAAEDCLSSTCQQMGVKLVFQG